MKKILTILFSIVSISVFAQKAEPAKSYEYVFSPGHYIRLAGNNMIIGESLSIASAVLIVVAETQTRNTYYGSNSDPNTILVLIAVVGELVSLGEFIAAGVNLHEAGKRMIELKMGLSSSVNRIGVTVNF